MSGPEPTEWVYSWLERAALVLAWVESQLT